MGSIPSEKMKLVCFNSLFEMVEIFKKYNLEDVKQSHIDLENRKIIGPAIIIP